MTTNFDEIFKFAVKSIAKMTMFQCDCKLYDIYQEYKLYIPYDMDTFFSLVHHRDNKLADDEHVKRLLLDGEHILEKYNKGCYYGTKDGVRYFNHFRRDNDGLWSFYYYEEKEPNSAMTVGDAILNGLLESARDRLQKLTSIEAPKVVVDKQEQYVEMLMQGKLPEIKGDAEVLDEVYIKSERKIGNGGKIYYTINDVINFFPNARYGMYIKRN